MAKSAPAVTATEKVAKQAEVKKDEALVVEPIVEVAPIVEAVVEVATEEVPPVIEPVAEVPPVIEPVAEVPPVIEPTVEVAAAPVVVDEPVPHYVTFFEQYITLAEANKSVNAVAALNNCVKSMLRVNTEQAFEDTFTILAKSNRLQNPQSMIISSPTLSFEDRTIFETVVLLFHVIFDKSKSEFDFSNARGIMKNDIFIDWCVKKLG